MASASGRAVNSILQPVRDASGGPLPEPGRVAGASWLAERSEAGLPALGLALDPLLRVEVARAAHRDRRGAQGNRIDGLAIGAPVTAAFIGVMLAKGELAGAPSTEQESAAAPVNSVAPGEASATTPMPGGSTPVVSAAPAVLEDGLVEGKAAIDPLSVGAPRAETSPTTTSGEQAAPATPSEAPAGETTAATSGGITINFSSVALGMGEGVAAIDVAADQHAPPIGAYTGGTTGDDSLQGTEQSDRLAGGAGDDVIYGLAGDDWLDGGSGDNSLFGGAGADSLLGGPGEDQLDGGGGNDLLLGGDGDDSLFGRSGDDLLDGGAGNDSLDGGSGADRLTGGPGDDVLIVGSHDDLALEYGDGADGGGKDVLQVAETFGSARTFVFGDDLGELTEVGTGVRQQVDGDIEDLLLTGSVGHSAIGDGRANSLIGNAGDNALYGAGGDDVLQGGDGDDLLDGGLGADRLEGGLGNDMLAGNSGDDSIWGGAGDDQLAGGTGADLLYGEAGDDAYVIGLNDSAVDTVFDHEGINRIVLEGVTTETVKAAIVGNDLYLGVEGNTVAVVSDYVGNEASFAGIDLGAGIVPIDDILVDTGGQQESSALEAEPEPAEDLLASQLSEPAWVGGDADDPAIDDTSGADWLHDPVTDAPQGAAGTEGLEDGAGHDPLQNIAEDDHYLLRSGESEMSTIRDTEGSNVVELEGFTGARLEGVVVGHDLIVVADYAPILKVENYVGNEASFAGLQVDDTFVPTEELFA